MKNSKVVPCSIVRGGTSKGVFFLSKDLPKEKIKRDQVIKELMGTPDKRQINGLGGGDILTSKVAIIELSKEPHADISYTFAQVGIEENIISYDGNCGNISAAVGPFAILKGLIKAQEPFTNIRILNTNINKIIHAKVPTSEGSALSHGEYSIDGVPGSGAKIDLDFSASVGSLTAGLLPTGKKKERLNKYDVSFIDLANPMVFFRAEDFGLTGAESAEELGADRQRIELFEELRGLAAKRLGFVKKHQNAFEKSPYIPFFCIVGKPTNNNMDITARLIGFKKIHKAFPGTGAACLAAASHIPGTIPYEFARKNSPLKIGHPSGVMPVEIEVSEEGVIKKAAFGRTWRMIMEGEAFLHSC